MEMMIAVAVSGFLIAGLTVIIGQIAKISPAENSELTAIHSLDMAGKWIVRDLEPAGIVPDSTTLTPGNNILCINQTVDTPVGNRVIYSIDSNKSLIRTVGSTGLLVGTNITEVDYRSGLAATVQITSTDDQSKLSRTYHLVSRTSVTTGPQSSASQLAFVQQPSNTASGVAIAPFVAVCVEDSNGNMVTTSSATVSLAISSNQSKGTLSGMQTVNATDGVATFSDLSINKAGSGYALKATSSGLTGATSTSFDVTAGAAAKLVFTVQPSNTAATSNIAPSLVVIVQDANGNTVTSSTAPITLALGTNPSDGTLSGPLIRNAVSGVATFSNLSVDMAGTGYTLTASSSGLTGATSTAFSILETKLVFTVQPGNTAATANIAPALVVIVQDANGNTVTSSTAAITLAIGTNPSGGALSGTTTVSAVNGVATFSTLSIDKAGTGYILKATSNGLIGGTSTVFNITVGAAAKLVFSQQPSGGIGGTNFGTQPVVKIEDAGDNTVTSSSASITLAIGTNPGDGTLLATVNPVSASSGVATFAGVKIDKPGMGYVLTASSSGLTGATSAAFNITFGAAAKLVFTVQPGNTAATANIAPALVVIVQDANGNTVTSSTAAITLAIGTNPSGGTLSGTATVSAVNGVATFSTLSIDKAGTGYILKATSNGLIGGTSTVFNITVGAAAKLVFSQQPSGGIGGTNFGTQPVVKIEDAGDNTVTSSSASITLAIGTNPGDGTLSATVNPVSASSGVATFAGVKIDKPGMGYVLTASSSGLTGATSAAFNITFGAAAKLVFTVQPGNTAATANIAPALVVIVQDANGNTVTSSTAAITLAIGTNPSGGALSGTATVSAVNGVATFSTLSIDKAGTGYILKATSNGLTGGTSTVFNITVGAAAKLVFSQQPSGGIGGTNFGTQPVVKIEDAGDNTVTSSSASITLAIGTNPGDGTLLATVNPVSASSGVATFAGVKIDKPGMGYVLTASSSGLTGATSAAFNITFGAAAKLVFTVQPGNTAATANIAPALVVIVQDANGNTVTSSTAAITLAIGTNPSGGTLSGTITVSAVNGVATFSTLSIDKAGTGYILKVTSSKLTAATSDPFNID